MFKKLFQLMIRSIFIACLLFNISFAQKNPAASSTATTAKIIPAAERMELYLPLLKNKSVGIFANASSVVAGSHLVDTLLKKGIRIKKIFAPEHGFRGLADAGEKK